MQNKVMEKRKKALTEKFVALIRTLAWRERADRLCFDLNSEDRYPRAVTSLRSEIWD